MSQGLDNDHIDLRPDHVPNRDWQPVPALCDAVKASTWTVTTVKQSAIIRRSWRGSARNSAASLSGSIRGPCGLIEGADDFPCQTLVHDLAVFGIQFDEHRISAMT